MANHWLYHFWTHNSHIYYSFFQNPKSKFAILGELLKTQRALKHRFNEEKTQCWDQRSHDVKKNPKNSPEIDFSIAGIDWE